MIITLIIMWTVMMADCHVMGLRRKQTGKVKKKKGKKVSSKQVGNQQQKRQKGSSFNNTTTPLHNNAYGQRPAIVIKTKSCRVSGTSSPRRSAFAPRPARHRPFPLPAYCLPGCRETLDATTR